VRATNGKAGAQALQPQGAELIKKMVPIIFALNTLPPGENPAEAFAKGGDSRSLLEVSSFRLRTHNNREVNLYNPSFVI
jgi:hypothetical protein